MPTVVAASICAGAFLSGIPPGVCLTFDPRDCRMLGPCALEWVEYVSAAGTSGVRRARVAIRRR